MTRQNNVMSSEINSGVHNNLFQNFTTAVVAAATKKDEFSVQENPNHHFYTLANYTNMTTLGKNESSSEDDNSLEDFGINYSKLCVMSAICIGTIIGNVAVILAIVARNIKMTRMYYFIIHLSIADLLTALLTLLPEIIWTATIEFYGGNFVCKSMKFAQLTGPYLSSYVLVMTAIDRYQAICNPMSNCSWTPRRSNIMIGIAWTISLLLCVPQLIIFSFDEENQHCGADFVGGPQGWGVKTYIVWYGISNFFVPLVILAFCYLRICYVIWENFNSKTINLEDNGEKLSFRQRLCKSFSETNAKWFGSRKSKYLDEQNEEDWTNAADKFRVDNEKSLGKMQWQKQSQCDDDEEIEHKMDNKKTGGIIDDMEMKPLIQKQVDVTAISNSNGDVLQGKINLVDEKMRKDNTLLDKEKEVIHIHTAAIVEPVLKIQVEPPSNNSNSGQYDSEIKTKVYVEFQAGKVQYPNISDSDSQSSGSTHKTVEATNNGSEKENGNKVTFVSPKLKRDIEHDSVNPRYKLRRSSSCELKGTEKESALPPEGQKNQKNNRSTFFKKSKSLGESVKQRQNSFSNVGSTKITPRTSSTKGISKAKIKTVKLTIAVILGYILCTAPFFVAQLWGVFGTLPEKLREYMMILYYCMTLNSVVNPWIYMMFNCNLVESLRHLLCPCIGSGCSRICPCLKDRQDFDIRQKNHSLRPGISTRATAISATATTAVSVKFKGTIGERTSNANDRYTLSNKTAQKSKTPAIKECYPSGTNKKEFPAEQKGDSIRQLKMLPKTDKSPNISQTSIAIISGATTNLSNTEGGSNRTSVGSVGVSNLPVDG